jgi:hypothetical protein
LSDRGQTIKSVDWLVNFWLLLHYLNIIFMYYDQFLMERILIYNIFEQLKFTNFMHLIEEFYEIIFCFHKQQKYY